MPKPIVPSWAIAAAILVIEDGPLYYRTLTARVLNAELCGLGDEGPTPLQTLRSDMMRRHSDLFRSLGGRSGRYEISNHQHALKHPDVRRAMVYLTRPILALYETLLHDIVVNGINLNAREALGTKNKLLRYEAHLARVARLCSLRT